MNILHRFLSALAWLQIFISPTILGLALGGLSWLYMPERWGLGVALILALLGSGIGIWLAEKARRRPGTIEFMSRTRSHPELRQEEK